jgi:signal transduction histidine kinase
VLPGNILSGDAFKAAIFSLIAFIAVFALASLMIVEIVRTSMINELDQQVAEEAILFQEIYRNQGPAALANAIQALTESGEMNQRILGLFSNNGNRLTGDVPLAPDFIGWGVIRHKVGLKIGEQRFRSEVISLDRQLMVVGRNMDSINATLDRLKQSLLLSGIIVALTSLVIGFVISKNVMQKLDRIASTLDEVSRGDTSIRLPVGNSMGQIDRVSHRINRHLDRLSALTHNMRNATTAIAHDLKTPLNRAYLLVQGAADHTRTEPERTEMLSAAEAEIEDVRGIFDTILRITRIQASDSREGFVRLSASALVTELAETYEPVLDAAGQSLYLDALAAGEAVVAGDRRMLWQMLVNLVENASRHTPAGTKVRLSVSCTEAGAVIDVADNGPGIPPDRMEEVMQPFTQISDHPERRGTGLGLGLVRVIADRHRAELELTDNQPGLRATVRFPPAGEAMPNAQS